MDNGTGKKPGSDPTRKDTVDKDETARQPDGAEALNDARALQQMVEGTADATDEFERIERKQ